MRYLKRNLEPWIQSIEEKGQNATTLFVTTYNYMS
jgi:hypothetical protein